MSPQVISEDEALAMNSMMYQVVQWGTGHAAAVPGHEVAGKTGTSADFRDAWFVGFSPKMITGVWVGNDDFTPMKKITGGTLPAQIWSGFMRTALKNAPPSKLPRAEPVPPEMAPDIASNGGDENLIERGLDGIGSFFNNLFGGGNA
jgi:penicillin-binding protein 1A